MWDGDLGVRAAHAGFAKGKPSVRRASMRSPLRGALRSHHVEVMGGELSFRGFCLIFFCISY
jgi:hypothetical protein